MAPTVNTKVIYKPPPMECLTPTALPEYFRGQLKFKATKQISMDLRVNTKEISKHRLQLHQIRQLERHRRLIKHLASRVGN